MEKNTFTVKPDHLKLMRRMYVSYEDCEFGAPCIDCKRPYGNGDGYGDIAEIISIKPSVIDEENVFSDLQREFMDSLHKGTQIALQIALVTGKFEVGTYIKDEYDINWRKDE